MMTCPRCVEQLLEYVYGLLDVNDPADAAIVNDIRTHLTTCASCQAALQKVEGQQKLLAEASRVPTNIIFTAPKMEVRQVISRRTSSVQAWYTSVASLLIALLGIMGAAYWWGTSTKWQPAEEARLKLEELRRSPLVAGEPIEALQARIALQKSRESELLQSVKELTEKTQRELWDQASYQQVFAPINVQTTNDMPLVVKNNTLNGQPAPLPELALQLKDGSQMQGAGQQFRNIVQSSSKLNLSLSSLAYANSAGKVFYNEVAQDISRNVLGLKLSHPLQVLQAEMAAHLCTDKPLYQPGEEIFFRGIALEKANFTVPKEDLTFRFKLVGPDEKVLHTVEHLAHMIDPVTQQPIRDITGKTLQGVGDGAWKLPANMPLGESTLILSEKNHRFAPQIVKFMVNAIQPPRLDKQLQFTRPSYAPGDPVVLDGRIKLPSQKPWARGTIRCQIMIDGEKYDSQGNKSDVEFATTTDDAGKVKLAFQLPATVSRGQGTLVMQFQGNDANETWTQPIRIETGALQVDCYPEGGELIAGVPNQVYFQVRNLSGEAIDGVADLVDKQGKTVQTLSTFNDETEARASRGMGKFNFVPQAGEVYQIKMKKPVATQAALSLPVAITSGVGLHIEQSVLQAGAPLLLQLSNAGPGRELVISVHCRDVLIALDSVSMAGNVTQSVIVDNIQPLGGIYRVTVSEYTTRENRRVFLPLAERLIYRHPSRTLNLGLKATTVPNKPTQLEIQAKTEKQQETSAYCTIVGVNKSLLQLAEATTYRRLPAHFLIAREVRQPEELEFADFFLSQHRSAPVALDLLLGVQGWRRFKESALEVAQQNNEPVKDLMIQCIDNRQEVIDQVRERLKKQIEQAPQSQALQATQQVLRQQEAEYQSQARQQSQVATEQQKQLQQTESLYTSRQAEWQQFTLWFHWISAGALGLLSLVGLASLCSKRSLLPVHLICTLAGLSMLGLLGAAYLWSKQIADQAPPPTTGAARVSLEEPASRKAPRQEQLPAPTKRMVDEPASSAVRPGSDPLKTESKQAKDSNVLRKSAEHEGASRQTELNAPSPSPVSPSPSAKPMAPAKTEKMETGKIVKGDSAGSKSNTQPEVPSGGKLRLSGGVDAQLSNRDYKQSQNNDTYAMRRSVDGNRNTKLADNRVLAPVKPGSAKETTSPTLMPSVMKDHSEKYDAPAKKKEVNQQLGGVANSKATTGSGDKQFVPPPGKPSPGGMGSGGGMGGGGLSRGATPPPASKSTVTADELQTKQGFYLREYSWTPATQPGNMKPTTTWGQTVYWHPLKVVPSTGMLTLPIELPPMEGVYQFEVFGHDGQGRLGSAIIDIASPALAARPLPVALQTKLSSQQAKVGEVVQLECTVQNLTSRRQPQVVAKIAIPEGVKLPDNLKQLRQAVRASTAGDYVEPTRWYIQGKELTLIWSEIAAEQKVRLSIDLVCQQAGQYQAASSRAYFENQERDAAVAEGLHLTVK